MSIGNDRPRFDVILGDRVSFLEQGWLPLITSIEFNRNNDKTAGRGHRKVKPNHAKMTIQNPANPLSGSPYPFDNILRWGHKVEIRVSYRGEPRRRAARYTIEEPEWDDGPTSSVVSLSCVGSEWKVALDKSARDWRGKTRSEVIAQIAAENGFATKIAFDDERLNISKDPAQDGYEFIESLGFDLGWDTWIDDSTNPPTLHFEPPEMREPFAIAGERLTVGTRPPATLRASNLKTKFKIPTTTVGTKKRTQTGARLFRSSTAEGGSVGGVVDVVKEHLTVSQGNTSDGATKKRVGNLADSATTKRTIEVTLPYLLPADALNLNQLVPIVGHGDRNGIYRIVDITIRPIDGSTVFKAVIGSGAASAKAQKGPLAKLYRSNTAFGGTVGGVVDVVPDTGKTKN